MTLATLITAGDRLQAAGVLPDDGQGKIQRGQEQEPGSHPG